MTPQNDIATLARRLQEVEANHARLRRRTRWLQIGCIGGIGAMVLLAASDVTRVDTLRAHRLEIIDVDGNVVLAASGHDSGGQLDLWSPAGTNVMRMAANQHGGDVAVWNTAGVNVAGIWATPEGGEFGAWNTEGARGASIAAGANGGLLTLGTGSDTPKLELASGTEPAIRMRDASGVARSTLEPGLAVFSTGDGAACLTLSSQADQPSLLLSGPDNAQITAAFSDQGGHVRVSSPTNSAQLSGNHVSLSRDDTTMAFHATSEGGQWQCGDGTLQLKPHSLALLHQEDTLLRAGAADGQVSLRLDAPSGSASITAGDATSIDLNGRDATITLAGKATESVTVASGATLPILKTADDALSLFASNGAGRVVLGSGEAGQIRLTGGTDGMRPAVDILAADRTRIASLTATAHGLGMLAVADASGAPVGLLHAAGTGRGRLTVRGRGGSAVATAASDGTPEFALLTADGHTTAALAATPRGGALNLMNAEGTPVVLAGITADGPGGAAAFQNGSGVTVVAAGSTKDDTGRVVVTE